MSAAERIDASSATEDDHARAEREAGEMPNAARPTAQGFATIPIGEVADEGPVTWRVRDLWTEEAVGVVAGEPKTYKSFLTAHIGVCVAAGVPVLGTYEVSKGRVLMFNAEDRPAMTRSRMAQMCVAMGLELSALDLRLINVPVLRLDDAAQIASLRATVARERPALLILDPLRDLHTLDENDARAVSGLLMPLRAIQRECHCAVMVVHHMAKLTEVNKRPGQRMRGSGALHGWVDSALYLAKGAGEDVAVHVEHRGAPTPSAFGFAVRRAGMEGHESLTLERTSGVPSKAPGVDLERGLRIIREAPRPISADAFRKAFGNHDDADDTLAKLRAANAVKQVSYQGEDVNGKARTFKGWTVATPGEADGL
ncbi:MAG: AAA family ATPase [Deltaproteobacteria bacterium]|nr:AAA family ATPase [Deltaproteobacteria bacterium]